jgi:hypothetical protein
VMVMTVVMGPVVMTVAMTMAAMAAAADHGVNTAAGTATATVTAVATVTAMTAAAGVSSRRNERRQTNNGRGDKSEKCSAFEHCERPFGSGEPSEPVVGIPGPRVQTIDFQRFFVHLTFIDGAMVWHDGGSHHSVTACAAA